MTVLSQGTSSPKKKFAENIFFIFWFHALFIALSIITSDTDRRYDEFVCESRFHYLTTPYHKKMSKFCKLNSLLI